jgi:hypothetical protein
LPFLARSSLNLGPIFRTVRNEEPRQTPALGERPEVLPQLRTDAARIGSSTQLSDSGGVPSEKRFFARWQDSERKTHCCLQLGSPEQIRYLKWHPRTVRANVTQIERTPEEMRMTRIPPSGAPYIMHHAPLCRKQSLRCQPGLKDAMKKSWRARSIRSRTTLEIPT